MPGAEYTTWYKSGKWDGKHRFLERPSNRFYTGLIGQVRAILAELGEAVEEVDTREIPPRIAPLPTPPLALRPYQEQVADAAEKAERGILKVGTGGGKTVIAGHLIARLRVRTLFLVHRKELADQAAGEFASWFGAARVGRIGDQAWDADRDVVVAMIQTLYVRFKRDPDAVLTFLESRGAVVVDEVHRAPAASYERLLRRCPAYWRYGLSGTPFVKDEVRNWTVRGLLGEQLVDIPAAKLAAEGWLAKPVCVFLSYPDGTRLERATYRDAYNGIVVGSPERLAAAAHVAVRHPKAQILWIVRQIKHGEHLADALGVPFISGEDPTDARRETYAAFRAGTLRRLVASIIYDEAVDFPLLDVVVNGAGGWTVTPLFQRLGRAMHRRDTSRPVWYYDFLDLGNKHLRRHALGRRRELVRAGFEVRDG